MEIIGYENFFFLFILELGCCDGLDRVIVLGIWLLFFNNIIFLVSDFLVLIK